MGKWYWKRRFILVLLLILMTGGMLYILMTRFAFQTLATTVLINQHPPARTLQLDYCNKNCREKIGRWAIQPSGLLGHQMGEYATLYALAKLNGHTAYILPEMYKFLSPVFKISLSVLLLSEADNVVWHVYWINDWMTEKYKHINEKNLMLIGFPCSWTFYDHIRDEILKEFTFHDFITDDANVYLEKLKAYRKNVTYIGVHVSRGDSSHVIPNIWNGVMADKAYLEYAMAYFREAYQEPVFVVVSNGMGWCKDNIDASKGDVYFSGDGNENSPTKDFALLAHCNHTIMTIGTFGYWAAYLSGGMTIYLTNFTLPDSPLHKYVHYDSAFLPHWIGVGADLSPLTGKRERRNCIQFGKFYQCL